MRRRAATALALLAAAAALSLGAGPGGGLPDPVPAQAEDCVPVQQQRTVVKRKKVRRKGKVVKVKRRKVLRWTACVSPEPVESCPEPSSTLGVTARDSAGSTFTLSRPCVSAGLVTIQLNNLGEDAHNVFLAPAGSGLGPVHRLPGTDPFEVPSLQQAEGTFELTRGDWYLWCDLLSHEEQGMAATLRVR